MKQLITTPRQAGHIFAARRKALKLSQQEVALRLGISQNRYSELEADASRLTLDRLIAIAGVLGMELVFDIKLTGNPPQEW